MAGQLTIDTLRASSGVLATQNGMTGIAKAWANFQGGGSSTTAGTINGSFNVSSITVNGTGDYTLNFTTALTANYAWSGSGINAAGTGPALVTWTNSTGTQSTTQLRVKTVDSTAANTSNFYQVSVLVLGS